MAIRILPFIKALAPYIAQIAIATLPSFTSESKATILDPGFAKEIEELKSMGTKNAKSIQVLAEKMQQVIQRIEPAAQENKKQVQTFKIILFLTFVLSIASLSTCIYLLIK